MFANPIPGFLYSSYKIVVGFSDDVGTTKSVQGTGFIIQTAEGDIGFVTNRHIVDLTYKEQTGKYKDFYVSSITVTGRRDDDSLYRFSIQPSSEPHFSREYLDDVAIFIRPHCKPVENMPEMSVFYHFGMDQLADDNFFESQLVPFDVVAFTGFPEEHDLLAERPLLRGGRIASDPKFDFSISGKPAGRCIAYEAFSHGGASGSPVLAVQRGVNGMDGARSGRLVGINSGHIHRNMGQHSGISYFYRSSIILDIFNEEKRVRLGNLGPLTAA